MIIVTLSLVCTLKGMCQYNVQRIKAMHVCVKMMSKGWKEALTVLIVTHGSSQKSRKWCLRLLHNTAYRVTQFVTHVKRVKCTLHTVASRPCQEGRLLCEPSILGV